MTSMGASAGHTPVLIQESLEALRPSGADRILDCTVGAAGHAAAFLHATGEGGTLVACDADPDNLALARGNLSQYGDRVHFIHSNFGDLAWNDIGLFDCIFADLGLSSLHLDDAARGFSFRFDAPLDLRFDRTRGETAASWLDHADEDLIATVLRTYGELKQARGIAKAIVASTIRTTGDLKSAVEHACGFRAKVLLPQVFQALRIARNSELEMLGRLLDHAPFHLRPGGRFAVISFHSLEDRMVKARFRMLTTPEKDPDRGSIIRPSEFVSVTKRAIVPSDDEVTANPRSRSAKLRCIRRAVKSD